MEKKAKSAKLKPTKKKSSEVEPLPKTQQKKLQAMMKSADSSVVATAFSILQASEVPEAVWDDIFSPTVLTALVNSWDRDVWKAAVDGLRCMPSLLRQFSWTARDRAAKRPKYKNIQFVDCVLVDLDDETLAAAVTMVLPFADHTDAALLTYPMEFNARARPVYV